MKTVGEPGLKGMFTAFAQVSLVGVGEAAGVQVNPQLVVGRSESELKGAMFLPQSTPAVAEVEVFLV